MTMIADAAATATQPSPTLLFLAGLLAGFLAAHALYA